MTDHVINNNLEMEIYITYRKVVTKAVNDFSKE